MAKMDHMTTMIHENTTAIDHKIDGQIDFGFMDDMPTCTPTKKEVNAFTNGDCWYFALHVNKVYGYPIVVHLFDDKMPEKPEDFSMAGWVHAYNMLPDGSAFDVTGVYPMYEMEEAWGEVEICKGKWNAAYIFESDVDKRNLFERRDRLYPKVDVDKAVRKAHRAYVGEN